MTSYEIDDNKKPLKIRSRKPIYNKQNATNIL